MTRFFSSNNEKLNVYREFIRNCTNSPSTETNYSNFGVIDSLIRSRVDGFTCLLDYDDPSYVQKLYDLLCQYERFEEFDGNRSNEGKPFIHIGGNQYHNALLTYIRFLYAIKLLKQISKQPSPLKQSEHFQQIFFGAPGTSKSTTIKQKIGDACQHRITFHPDTDYSNFVGCYKPTTACVEPVVLSEVELGAILQRYHNISPYKYNRFGGKYWRSLKEIDDKGLGELSSFFQRYGGKESDLKEVKNGMAAAQELVGNSSANEITYEFVPQVFVKAYVDAWTKLTDENDPKKEVYLIIEEINRGNCAQIFGDLFQLLDRDDDGYSDYEIEPDSDLQRYLAKAFRGTQLPDKIKTGEVMQLPPNFYIWATMNTSDQSLFPIDSAFKRRWEWKYLPIKNDHKGHVIRVDAKHSYDWWQFLEAVNTRIEKLTELEDKQLGYWFAKPNEGIVISCDRFVSKVVFYLWNDVFKDYGSDGNSPFVVK